MDRGHIPLTISMKFFKKQLSTFKISIKTTVKEIQEAQIQKLLTNYETKQMQYGLRECMTTY